MHLFHFQAGQRLPRRPRPATDPAYQRRGAGAHRDPGRPAWFGCLAWLPAAFFLTSSFLLVWSGMVFAALVLTIAGFVVAAWVFARLPRVRR